MTRTPEQTKDGNVVERGVRFLRDVHIAIGAAALGAAIIFPPAEILISVAAYEGVNALAHEGLRQVVKSRRPAHS